MKKITLVVTACIAFSFLGLAQNTKQKMVFGKPVQHISPDGYIRCATTEYEEYLQENDPKRATSEQFENWLQPLIAKYKEEQMVSSQSGGIIYIPVVVHVIHNGDALGSGENITDAQVQSQITVMTQDFRRMAGTPGFNSSSIGADTQIEFVLAKVDPNGNPTNGIDRVNLCQASWSTAEINSTVKPATIWDPTLYMNMWSVVFTDATLLGYAQFPAPSGLGGISGNGGSATTDGVVAGFSFFGSSALSTGNFQPPYDKGRTMTHEVGHFLGLLHTFQGGCGTGTTNSNFSGDFCSDTPAVGAPNYGCVANTDSCPAIPGIDMIENYMDYTDDACMNIFTQVQRDRIATIMANAPRRASLATSTKDIAIALFPNDAEVKIENSCNNASPTCAVPNPPMPAKVISLYNRGTSNLTSATLNYTINGGATMTNNWTGNLAPNSFAYITLANTETNGTLNVSIAAVNGTTDQRATNNTATKTFTGSAASISNFAFTTFNFNLIGDRYGVETTWTLNDATGTALYSGGPYTNATANGAQNLVVNQTWTLPTGGCYTFTLSDTYGDGICCTYGNGSYSVTTNNGATQVISGSNFLFTESKAFTTGSLSNNAFNALSDIYAYPNPASDLVTISMPDGVELPKNLEVYNSLGQLIDSKNVQTINDLSIKTHNYSSGVYFIAVSNNTASKTLRFVKK